MIVRRLYDDELAQASYLIGCGATGEAIVIDPLRDIEQYLEVARSERVRITHVTETHIHADFVSGARDLAKRTGATLYLSDEGPVEWKYAFTEAAGAVLLHEGDRIGVGNVLLDVVHTPGHTPEHLTFIVTDSAAADEPIAALTGDFVFVGDVGRPDLLEKAAGVQGTMESGARSLFRSLQRFASSYSDWLQIWPGHGAGSACGKGLSAVPHSTLGYEKRFNWAFGIDDEQGFVDAVLSGQPDPPAYFARMKQVNRDGPAPLGSLDAPPLRAAGELADVLASGQPVIDLRRASAFARAHVPGTISIPYNRSFSNYAGSLLPFDRDLYLIADGDDDASVLGAVRALARIGYDRIVGRFDAHAAVAAAGTATLESMDAQALAQRLDDVALIDVRSSAEYEEGHVPGAPNIPLGQLPRRLDELPTDRPLVLQCASGARSAIAASLIEASGRSDVSNLEGGFTEWEKRGLPVEHPERSVPV